MKTKLLIGAFCFIFFSLFQISVNATNYYVSLTGNDSNNGLSSSTAWRTIGKACSSVTANQGNIIYIGAGTFLEANTISIPSGITITGAGKGSTTIQGASTIFRCENKSHIVVSDFKIDGRNRTSSNGFYFKFCDNIEIKNFTMTGFGCSIEFRSGHDCKVHDFDGTNVSYCTANGIAISSWVTDLCENFEIYNGNCTNDNNYHGKIVGGGVDQTMPGYDGHPWDMPDPLMKNIKIHDITFHTSVVGCYDPNQAQLGLEFWKALFQDCEIYNMKCNMPFSMAVTSAPNTTTALRIHHCRWEDCGDYGIECFPGNFEIDHNYFDGCSYPLGSFGNDQNRHSPNLKVHHNVFYGTQNNACMNIGESYDGIKFYKNTIYTLSQENAFNLPGSINIEVNNNIFYSTVAGCNPSVSANVHDNLFYNWNSLGMGAVTRNPNFNGTGNKPSPFFKCAETAYGAYADGDWTAGPGATAPPQPPATAIPGKIEAENYTSMSGVQTETTTDVGGGLNAGWIDAGDWMDYLITVPTAGNYTVDFRLASTTSNNQIELRSGSTILTTVNVPNTGAWQNWQTVTPASFALNTGNQTIRVYAKTGGWNINWMNFVSTQSNDIVTARGDNAANGEGIDKLYDGNTTTKWLDKSATSWVQWQYATAKTWNKYDITSGNDNSARDPKNWNLKGSNNGTSWTTLSTLTNQTWSARNLTKSFTFTNSSSYKYYRWEITANNGTDDQGNSYIQSSEFAFSFNAADILLQAESYNAMNGILNKGTTIGNFENGDWVRFDNVNLNNGYNTFTARLACDSYNAGNKLEVRLDSQTGTLKGTLTVPNTGGWTTFQDVSINLTSGTGIHAIYFVGVTPGSGAVGDFDWFKFAGAKTLLKSGKIGSDSELVEENTKLDNGVKIYPNPSNGLIKVEIAENSFADIFIYNMQGKLMYSKNTVNNGETIDLNPLKGEFIIQVKTKNESVKKKLILLGN